MPDTDIAHGTRRGHAQHLARGTTPCERCYAADADYHQAWRILAGGKKNLLLPIQVASRLLRGDDPAEVLATVYGPLTLDALRQHGLVDGQVPRG